MSVSEKHRVKAMSLNSLAQECLILEKPSDEAISAIAAALATAEREGMKREGWQDIATAPIGEWVLFWIPPAKIPGVGRHRGRGKVLTIDGAFGFATHWMPLPTPPSEAERTA